MTLTTQSALAREVGISRQAINDAINKNVIPHVLVNGKKKIDLDDPVVKNYLKGNCQRKPNKAKQEKPEPKEKQEPKKKGKKQDKNASTRPPAESEFSGEVDLNDIRDLSSLSKYDLERYQKMVDIEQRKIKTRKERGELIDVEIVKKAFSKLYQIDVNNFLQLSHALAPRISQSIFKTNDPEKITELTRLIDEELYKTQSYIQKEIDDFLKTLSPDEKEIE